MRRFVNWFRNYFRMISWIFSATYITYRRLPEKSQNEIYEIAKNPSKWGNSIEKAWDISKISAEHFKNTSETLANIVIGRKISKKRRKEASQYDFEPMQNVISESTQRNMIQAYRILQEQA